MIKAVCGLIYDDTFKSKFGMNRFYYLNGEIEKNGNGEDVYTCCRYNENTGRNEDISERVVNLPDVVQKFIRTHVQKVTDRGNIRCIGVNSSEL